MSASISLNEGNLILKTAYNRKFVDDLKNAIPPMGRRWDNDNKVWIIGYMFAYDVINVVKQNLGIELSIPKQFTQAPQKETRIFKIEYIGAVKERENGELSAMAWANGNWSVVFSLASLREWFEGDRQETVKPGDAPNFYVVLGVKRNCSDLDIKRAYRIAAKTWHPDVNNDLQAADQFRLVQKAYETLSENRRKYDAGLKFEQDAKKQKGDYSQMSVEEQIKFTSIFRPPKRCGMITVEGQSIVGRFIVERILFWDDILDMVGKVAIAYWEKGKDTFTTEFI
jgi:hypothetical protein